jgi:nucleoid DNA-binding protein
MKKDIQRYYSKELMDRVATKTGMDANAIRIIANSLFDEIEAMLLEYREVNIFNFGRLYLKLMKKRGYDCIRKIPMEIKTQRINFVPSRRLKDYINRRKRETRQDGGL